MTDKMAVQKIEYTPSIKSFIQTHHYLKTAPINAKIAYGLFLDKKLMGVGVLGHISDIKSAFKYKDCVELRRLVLLDEAPKNSESFFLGKILADLKGSIINGVLSYSDPNVDHEGTIYKAANFKFLGKTHKSIWYKPESGDDILHSKTVKMRAKKLGIKESEYAKKHGLVRTFGKPKNIFFYEIFSGYLEKFVIKKEDVEVDVYWYKRLQKWMSIVFIKGCKNHVGYFHTQEEAIFAADEYAKDMMSGSLKSDYPLIVSDILSVNDFDNAIHATIKVGKKYFIVDKCDLDFLLSKKWDMNSTYLTDASLEQPRFFHRRIMDAQDGYIVDHINGCRNDNRRINLRCVKHSVNNHNVERVSKSGFIGVKIDGNKKGFETNITFNNTGRYLGHFKTAEDAAKRYDEEAVKIYGKNARTNFDISNYEIPDSPEIDSLPLMSFKLGETLNKCLSPNCATMIKSSNSEFCYRCRIKNHRREIAEAEGREVNKYAERVKESVLTCTVEGCSDDVFARNVCNKHWREQKKAEGTLKKQDKKIYPCMYPGCEAQYQHKENFCLVHWRESKGIKQGARTGRPGKDMVDCKECGKPQSATQPSMLCRSCWGRWYRSQNPDKRRKKNQN